MPNAEHARLLQDANALRQKGQPERAMDLYREILADEPQDLDALRGAGLTEFALGHGPEGMELLRHVIMAKPDDAEAARAMVDHMMIVGHITPARGIVTRWLRADPGNVEARSLLQQLQSRTDNTEPAETDALQPGIPPRPAPREDTFRPPRMRDGPGPWRGPPGGDESVPRRPARPDPSPP